MPNSSWTETGSSISLTPVTTTINAGSDAENVNYLSNQDKINLMAQYSAELAMKTSLDTLASTWSVSSTYYDNAVAAISTALINAGAPSNWATTWPDGTTSGPWPNIQTSLANLWAQVAVQRTALQSTISNAQAAAAQAAAVAAATALAPAVGSSLPTLPNSSYPAGKYFWDTANNQLYESTGSTWTPLAVSASNIAGVLGSVNILYNCDFAISSSGVPAGFAYYNNGGISLTNTVNSGAPLGSANYWRITANAAVTNTFGFFFPSDAADFGGWKASANYVVSFYARVSSNPSNCTMRDAWDNPPATVNWLQNPVLSTSWQRYVVLINFGTNTPDANGFFTIDPTSAPSGFYIDFACPQVQQGDAPTGWAGPITASTIAANTITANQIAAGTITANQIAAGTITGNNIAAGTITAGQLAAGSVTATQLAANSVTAGAIAAGAITASMITSGTLNAANVNVTNLNASNITTGTLAASQISFPDGSTLTTAGVQTQVANETNQAHVSGVSTPGTVIPGLSLSVTTASTSDVYNLFISLCLAQTAGTPGDNCVITIEVDGVAKTTLYVYCATLNVTQSVFTIASLTGLAAGTHTITFYLGSTLSVDGFTSYPTSMVLCQRIF
jgi:hypothetical protein